MGMTVNARLRSVPQALILVGRFETMATLALRVVGNGAVIKSG